MDRLNAAIELISSEQIPEEVCRFFECSPDAVCRTEGRLYLLMEGDALSCKDTEENQRVLSAIQRKIRSSIGANTNDVWYKIIKEAEPDRIRALAREYGIDFGKKRTVVLFRVKNSPEQPLNRIFNRIAPLEEGDHLATVDRDTLALIRESAFRSEDETAEYAAAVIDTMISEGYTDLQAGIGTEAENLGMLHKSFEEAANALITGTRYHPDGTLYRYSKQKVERIIDAIPAEQQKKFANEFRFGSGEETLDEEKMETIRVFFANDLNITAASKELFIHRNTLNYRLDKVKHAAGLDVRNFQDAVVFRIMFGMIDKIR